MKKIIYLLPLLMSLLIACDVFSGAYDERWAGKFNAMIRVPGGTFNQTNGSTNFNHTISSFFIAKYEVTYELWYIVYQWAIQNGYNFANTGTEGSAGVAGSAPTTAKYEPVTMINWRDAMVWCNAYSEMSGLTPCYTSSGVLKNSTLAACDSAVCDWSANGYRLPSEGEWEYAARNRGATPYNYASGGYTGVYDPADTNPVNGVYDNKDSNDLVAVYVSYFNGVNYTTPTGVTKTADVGTKSPNGLGIYDMSGNVYEFCWDWSAGYPSNITDYRGPGSGTRRVERGGGALNDGHNLQCGIRFDDPPTTKYNTFGFRVARSQ
jgi:sulfatase modifying factor 1